MIYKNSDYANSVVQGIIHEYDISAAGINVMYAEGIINKGLYDYWMSLPKDHRNVLAGKHIGNNKLQDKKEEALNKYIDLFIKENEIPDTDIMEIASDAIWLFNSKRITFTQFKNVVFRFDRSASILISWNNYRFYYDSWSGDFFARGYTQDTPFIRKVKELLAMIEQNVDQITIYKFLHELKMDVLNEELQFIEINKTIEFIDWLIEQFIK